MTKSIGLTVLCAGMLLSAGQTAPLRAATAAVHMPQWKSRAEYDAFAAFYKEKDTSKQIPLIEAFLKKYPSSEFKDRAYLVEMEAYRKLGDSAKAIEAARNALKFDPSYTDPVVDDPALGYLAFAFPYTYHYSPGETAVCVKSHGELEVIPEGEGAKYTASSTTTVLTPQECAESRKARAEAELNKAETQAQEGLALLSTYQAAMKVPDANITTMRAWFNTAIGFANLQQKNYSGAITVLQKAAKEDPSNSLIFSLMGQAYYYSTPPDYNNAIWNLARAASLANAANSPNAAQLQSFLSQVYKERHCTDAGLSGVLAQAATSVAPPAGFSVSHPQKHALTGDKTVDAWYQNIEDPMTVDCMATRQNWAQLKGQPLSLPGRVVSVTPNPDGNGTIIDIAITPNTEATAGQFDVQLLDTSQPDAKLLQPNDPLTFNGTLSAYQTTPNFYVTLSNATVNEQTIKMAEEREKAAEQAKKLHHPAPRRGR